MGLESQQTKIIQEVIKQQCAWFGVIKMSDAMCLGVLKYSLNLGHETQGRILTTE